MKNIFLFITFIANFQLLAATYNNEIRHVCKAVSRSTRDYRGASYLEPSRILADVGVRRACFKLMSAILPNYPKNYCEGDFDIEIICEEVSLQSYHSTSFTCQTVHWNGGGMLGAGSGASRFLAEESAIQNCRKNHKKDLGYPSDYCESQSVFKCDQN